MIPPTPLAVDTAVQAVQQTFDKVVQAGPPPHQEGVLAEQVGQPLQAGNPQHHRPEDLLCRDSEYLPTLGQFPRVTSTEWTETKNENKTWRILQKCWKIVLRSNASGN